MAAPVLHHPLGASSAHRWMNCPGSVELAKSFPNESTIYAEEGSLAHELAEIRLKRKPATRQLRKIRKFYDEHPELDGSQEAMEKALLPYLAFCEEALAEAQAEDPAAEMLTEQRVDLSRWIPGGFGTTDVAIIGGTTLHVIDLKYGKGVPVSAVNNPQINIYALGTINMLEDVYDIETVKVTIYQPRLDNVSTETYYVEDLLDWGEAVLAPAAQRAMEDDAWLLAGDWCRFCPAKAKCIQRTDTMLHTAKAKDRLLTNEELGEILGKLDDIVSWANDLKAEALASAQRGEKIPGWKVVEGRSIRKYTGTEEEIVRQAEGAGFDRALLYETKLLTVAQMEKLMGKKTFESALGAYVEKPQGKPTLVSEEDPRPPFPGTETAAEDFADEF